MIYRTANLEILKTAILGGQIDGLGGTCESDHSFTHYNEHLKSDKNNRFDLEKIKQHIEFYIEEYGNNTFKYYHNNYKFKKPSTKNLHELTLRIWQELTDLENEFLCS